MYKLFWFVVLVAIVYFGYRAYMANKPVIGSVLDQATAPKTADYSGTYVSKSGTIDVDETSAISLKITGTATWVGQGSTNTADISGNAALNGNTATFTNTDGCHIVMTFDADSTMTARDNNACGGFNSSFTDTYKRQ